MKKVKRFVVLDTCAIIDLATYGMESWGSDSQCGIKVKGNKVYGTYWEYRGDLEEDINVECFLGTIVYQSDKPFNVLESSVSRTATKPNYSEYGADFGKPLE